MRSCPAWLIAAPASGQGKTTLTSALARFYRDRDQRVRVFKVGPDFLDPMILERASGNRVYQLDLWMVGEAHCRQLLYEAAADADVILIEGVMGLFDGQPSSADLAELFNIPVLALIDGSAMAQTFGAIAYGLSTYRSGLQFDGVFANRVGSQGHYQMLLESLPAGLPCHGRLAHDSAITLPDRHLGLLQAVEIEDLDTRIVQAAAGIKAMSDQLPPLTNFNEPIKAHCSRKLEGIRIGVARDEAFAFLYHANLDLLKCLGAELIFFSPLADSQLPTVDALYLPGGYPELNLDRLANNKSMKVSIRAHHDEAKPILAECGGMLYLQQSLTDVEGQTAAMVGLLPSKAVMRPRLCNLGLHSAVLPEGELRGHTYHHSEIECELEPVAYSISTRHHGRAESIYQCKRLTASYLHFYFPSNPDATAALFLP
ncbi:MAG: cobyrinate a,c-diamide synthase [Cycloclasticus sp.]|nr:cobyrinate a,c-diamide synthase [Cycloclasticus sp.]